MNRESRREDLRSRRKTLRQSALDAKRGVINTPKEAHAQPQPAGRVTRGALRAQDATRKAEELKTRKAITDREVRKAKPPFNPYVRVKHTGLSPFRSYQDSQKRSKIATWRATAPKPPAAAKPRPVASGSRSAAPAHGTAAITKPVQPPVAPEMKMAAGVAQFPILPHMHHAQITFRAPPKVQPIPLTARPIKSTLLLRHDAKETVRPALPRRSVRRASLKSQAKLLPKSNSHTKLQSAATKPNLPQRVPKKAEPPKIVSVKTVTQPVSARNAGAKTAAPAKRPAAKTVVPKRPEPPAKKARFPLIEKATVQDPVPPRPPVQVKPPGRVLRSSSRLQHKDKENLPDGEPMLLELPLVQRRRTKKQTTVAPKEEPEAQQVVQEVAAEENMRDAAAITAEVTVGSSSMDDRIRGLQDRSSKLAHETERLKCLADKWVAEKTDNHLSQNVIDEIDAVTGQTYLLISKKFVQYKGLIEGAFTNPKTTLDDLDGFWEMVYIQVDQLESQFRNLEDMKKRNWTSNSPAPIKKQTKKLAKLPKRPPPNTNFRKFLAEKKKETLSAQPECAGEERIQDVPKPPQSPGLNMSVEEGASPRAAHSLLTANTPRTPKGAEPYKKLPKSSQRTPNTGKPRAAESPLSRSFRAAADSPRTAESPRALENARRASQSIRLSTTMMRVSLAIASELDTTTDPLAI